MNEYSYFPGCSYHTSAKEYDISSRVVCQKLGIPLAEIPDWNCCGSTVAHSTSSLLATSLAARNLVLAEQSGRDIVTSCTACYQRLAMANYRLKNNSLLLDKVNKILARPYHKSIKVKSMVEVISESSTNLASKVARPLKTFKVAAYYGCLLVRPSSIQIDDAENPLIMDALLQKAGAETVDWGFKTECCGASLAISNEDVVLKLISNIIRGAQEAGANCIVTACSLCHFNLDVRQIKMNKILGTDFELPVFYFTQLIGLSLGIDPEELSFKTHFVNPYKLLQAANS